MPINDSPSSTWGKTPEEKATWVKKYSPKSEENKEEDISFQPIAPKSEEALRMEEWAREHRGPFTVEIPEEEDTEAVEDEVELPEDEVDLPEDDDEVD